MSDLRYRKRGGLGKAAYVTVDKDGPLIGGTTHPPVINEATHDGAGYLEEITDISTPNFKQLQSEGHIVMTPLHMVKTLIESRPESWVIGTYPYWGSRTITGEVAAVWAVDPTWPSWYDTRVTDWKYETITRAHAKVATSDFQSLVSVAEAGKTAKMIAGPFSGAEKILKQVYQRKAKLIGQGFSVVAAAAKAWNEFRFGWKPVLHDIEGIMDSYAAAGAVSPKPVRLTARASGFVDYQPTEDYSLFGGLATMIRDINRQTKVSSGVIYELREDNAVDERLRSMSLRLSDVPASLWELVPWSFVVDRFLTVGSWLQAIVPKPGVEVLGSWTTTVEKCEVRHFIMELTSSVYEYQTNTTYPFTLRGSGEYKVRKDIVSREVNPRIPISPVFNPKTLGLQQQIDHVALLVDQIHKLGLPKRTGNPF